MKSNVEAMDGDMTSVKLKMQSITEYTTVIDNSLSEKRTKVCLFLTNILFPDLCLSIYLSFRLTSLSE